MLTPAPRIGKFAGPAVTPPATVKRLRRKREKATKPAPAMAAGRGLINR